MYTPVTSLIIDNPEDFEISESFSCNCKDCDSSCPCITRYSPSTFQHIPFFECNQNCSCTSCPTKTLQNGSSYKFSIKPSGLKGLGVYAEEPIPVNTFITEYAGRLVDSDTEGEYVFQLIENTPSKSIKTTIDASFYGNFARFFNHSCDPNLDIRAIRINYIVPHLAFFTTKQISHGEELSFKYRENHIQKTCLCGSSNCKGLF